MSADAKEQVIVYAKAFEDTHGECGVEKCSRALTEIRIGFTL
jgi:hypothetical protein